MPINYNPGVVDRSGEIMAQGIRDAGGSISGLIDGLSQKVKQTKAMRTMAVDGLGMDPEEVDGMDLPTLQGKLQGAALKTSREYHSIMQENEVLKHAMMQRSAANDVALPDALRAAFPQDQGDPNAPPPGMMPGAAPAGDPTASPAPDPGAGDISRMMTAAPMGLRDITTGAPVPAGPPPAVAQMMQAPMTQQQRIAAAIRTPGLNAAGIQEVMGAIRSGTPPAMLMQPGLNGDRVYGFGNRLHVVPGKDPTEDMSNQVTYEEDPLTGARFAHLGKTITATGMNPARAQESKSITLHDEDGNPTGLTSTWDGKRWIISKTPAAVTGKLKPVTDPISGKPIAGFGMDDAGKVHDFRSTMDKAMGTGGAAAAKEEEEKPLAMPKKQSDLKVGKRYQTLRGAATWDGSKFTQ